MTMIAHIWLIGERAMAKLEQIDLRIKTVVLTFPLLGNLSNLTVYNAHARKGGRSTVSGLRSKVRGHWITPPRIK